MLILIYIVLYFLFKEFPILKTLGFNQFASNFDILFSSCQLIKSPYEHKASNAQFFHVYVALCVHIHGHKTIFFQFLKTQTYFLEIENKIKLFK